MNIQSFRFSLLAAACLAAAAQAQMVKPPPPLPVGSTLTRPEPGMSEPERRRAVRAHHHKFENGRDFTRDDSVYGPQPMGPGALRATGTHVPGSGAAPGGAGTGPAREKTDKGASSYFFGNDKK